MRLFFALVALAGCGRLGFADREGAGDADVDPDGAGDSDAGPRANYAFMTEARVPGTFGGVNGADSLCTAEAAAAGIPGDYVALIWGTGRTDPAMALAGSRGWKLRSGEWLADTPRDVAMGSFYRPLNAFASGTRVDSTMSDGMRFWTGMLGGDCDDWSVAGSIGDQAYIPQRARLSDGPLACSGNYRIACFERGHSVVPVLPPITHKRLFVTAATWTPGGGIASADSLCASEAAAGGIGPAQALLPIGGSAVARIPGSATEVYQQPDGILIGTLARPDSYFIVGADKAPHDGSLWAGGDPFQVPAENCVRWTSSSNTQRAILGQTAWGGYGDTNDYTTCDRAGHLLCVEL